MITNILIILAVLVIAFIVLRKTKRQPIILRNPPEELRADPG